LKCPPANREQGAAFATVHCSPRDRGKVDVASNDDSRRFQQVNLQADLERLVAVDRNGKPGGLAFLGEDMVASLNALQGPAVLLKQSGKLLPSQRLHTAISMGFPVHGRFSPGALLMCHGGKLLEVHAVAFVERLG
jgi:hypothetical protein